MEKICKKKAVFRVEFFVHSYTEEEFEAMCTQLQFLLQMIKEQIRYVVDKSPGQGISSIAITKSVRRIAR